MNLIKFATENDAISTNLSGFFICKNSKYNSNYDKFNSCLLSNKFGY